MPRRSIYHGPATPFRERSHFGGRDVLESAIAKPGATDAGHALVALASNGRVDPQGSLAIGLGPVTLLVVRGQALVMSWVPQQLIPASEDTQARCWNSVATPKRGWRRTGARIQPAALGRAEGHRRGRA
jgi:uncharacterized protein (DUF1501 family)